MDYSSAYHRLTALYNQRVINNEYHTQKINSYNSRLDGAIASCDVQHIRYATLRGCDCLQTRDNLKTPLCIAINDAQKALYLG